MKISSVTIRVALGVVVIAGGGGLWLYAAQHSTSPPVRSSQRPSIQDSNLFPHASVVPPGTTTTTKIIWSVPELSLTMFPGTTTTTTVSFRSSENLPHTDVEVTPSLNGIVSVNPASIPSIAANQSYQLTFTLTAPPTFQKRSLGGTVHLRNGSTPPKTYGMPVTVNVQLDFLWHTNATTGLTIPYPLGWSISASDSQSPRVVLVPPGKAPDPTLEYIGDIIVTVFANPSGLDISSFYTTQAPINLFLNSEHSSPVTGSRSPAMQFLDIASMIPTDVVAVNIGRAFVELSDIGQQHRNDGLLLSIAKALQ